MKKNLAAILVISAALAVAPLSQAQAHGRGHYRVVSGNIIAAAVTLPFLVLAAPFIALDCLTRSERPRYYAPPQQVSYYQAPSYYQQPPVYYAPAPQPAYPAYYAPVYAPNGYGY